MTWFNTEEKFWLAFRRLQALSGQWSEWDTPRARTSHEDEFGVPIEPGEVYFRKQLGGAFSNVAKLSRRSMETLLLVTVETSPQMCLVADDFIGQANERSMALRGRTNEKINLDDQPEKK